MTSFKDFPLRPETQAALMTMGVETPTPIQTAAIPPLLDGRDLIGQARTGSGKTLAFALPLVERIDERQRDVQALILVPTRELAAQVAGVVRETAQRRGLRVLLLVGGLSAGPQTQALRHGVHVVAGTPGRVLDHIRQGTLRLERLRLLVLDEADEMLDRGFAPDVQRIIAATNPERQTALFSATVPEWVDEIAARHLRNLVTLRIDSGAQPVEHVDHAVYDVPAGGKLVALRTLLDARGPGVTLVFGRTKHGVKKLAKQLAALGYPVAALQGNLSQNARDRVMAEFRSGETPILIATNVAARGLDVEHVEQVINYELPETAGLLTHRVGRTGRMGRHGEAITLLTPEDEPAWRKLLRELRRHPIRRPWRGRHEPVEIHAEEPRERQTLTSTSASARRPAAEHQAQSPRRPQTTAAVRQPPQRVQAARGTQPPQRQPARTSASTPVLRPSVAVDRGPEERASPPRRRRRWHRGRTPQAAGG